MGQLNKIPIFYLPKPDWIYRGKLCLYVLEVKAGLSVCFCLMSDTGRKEPPEPEIRTSLMDGPADHENTLFVSAFHILHALPVL